MVVIKTCSSHIKVNKNGNNYNVVLIDVEGINTDTFDSMLEVKTYIKELLVFLEGTVFIDWGKV